MANPDIATAGQNTQFQPGQSGNPAGVPKGTKHLSTWIQDLMADDKFEANILDAKKGLVEYKGAPVKAIITVALAKAVNGDDKAREWLAKYGWGTKQTIEHEGSVTLGTPDPEKAAKFANFLKEETKD